MKNDLYLPKLVRRELAYAIAHSLHGDALGGHYFYPRGR